jgi:hypothetical protein
VKEGTEISQVAVVGKVNKLRYPDECYNKIMQMRAMTSRPIYLEPEYQRNQEKNYERYLFVSNKIKTEKHLETDDEDENVQKQLLNNHYGNKTAKAPNVPQNDITKFNEDLVEDIFDNQNELQYYPKEMEKSEY